MYVGLDIHSKQISVCVLDAQGRVTLRRQVRRLDQLLRLLEGLPRPWSVCYEASGGYGAIHDLLSPRAVRVPAPAGDAEWMLGKSRPHSRS